MGYCWQAFYWVVPRNEQGCSLSRSSRTRSLAFEARGLMAPIARGHPAAPGWGFVVVGEIVARRSWRASADRPGPRSRSTSLETGSVPWWPHKAPRTASALPCSDRRSRGHRAYCRRPPPRRSRDMRPRGGSSAAGSPRPRSPPRPFSRSLPGRGCRMQLRRAALSPRRHLKTGARRFAVARSVWVHRHCDADLTPVLCVRSRSARRPGWQGGRRAPLTTSRER